jgi:hypothetical protein
VALVIGCLLVLPALALLFGGGALAVGYAVARDDDGYFTADIDRIEAESVAVTAEDITFASDPGSPDWLFDWLDLEVRIRATPVDSATELFVGIAPEIDVDQYLAGVAHDEITDIDGREPQYRTRTGDDTVAPPGDQDFWSVSAAGVGTQEIVWEAEGGDWAGVLMNADGSPVVLADVDVGAKAGFVLPVALGMLGVGALLTVAAVVLIVVGAMGMRRREEPLPPPIVPGAPRPVAPVPTGGSGGTPVMLTAELDPDLSRWQWLVKWFLAIPHFIVLFFLWVAFFVLTVIAGFAILFTGRYPRGIFDFNVGVLRWTWRVSYYATSGGLGTDRYPPFSLHAEPDDLATLDIEYPERLSRGLVLVKWWLLAIPHYLVLAVLIGSWGWTFTDGGDGGFTVVASGNLLGLLVFFAAVVLLFTARYPRSLFDLVIGLNRWVYRVIAYAALMTDDYPPFRLDQGGAEPSEPPDGPPDEPTVDHATPGEPESVGSGIR